MSSWGSNTNIYIYESVSSAAAYDRTPSCLCRYQGGGVSGALVREVMKSPVWPLSHELARIVCTNQGKTSPIYVRLFQQFAFIIHASDNFGGCNSVQFSTVNLNKFPLSKVNKRLSSKLVPNTPRIVAAVKVEATEHCLWNERMSSLTLISSAPHTFLIFALCYNQLLSLSLSLFLLCLQRIGLWKVPI